MQCRLCKLLLSLNPALTLAHSLRPPSAPHSHLCLPISPSTHTVITLHLIIPPRPFISSTGEGPPVASRSSTRGGGTNSVDKTARDSAERNGSHGEGGLPRHAVPPKKRGEVGAKRERESAEEHMGDGHAYLTIRLKLSGHN